MQNLGTVGSTKEKVSKESLTQEAEFRKSGFDKRELFSQIEIEASPEKVWGVLTDFASFPDWNPFMRSVSGDLSVGGRLTVRLQPPRSKGATFKPNIIEVERYRSIRWLGHLLIPGLFDGEHILEILPVEGGKRVRFIQRELFSGLFLPFLSKMLKHDTAGGFVEMNKALKERCESGSESTF